MNTAQQQTPHYTPELNQSDLDTPGLARLQRLSTLLDSRFAVPGTNIRIGLDSLLGVIPGVGDTIGAAFTLYLLKKCRDYGLPKRASLKMLWNTLIDWLIGLIPLVGDIFDIGWKANQKNMAIFMKYHEK